ncbi:hypothetical protein LSTR_LSTR013709 [Laodelphax striatellus]|uniref:Uncharacterized protein n=1 Tax=Laodelphax striatellus TaxID=195883 RepID=A0A482XKI7_LAOST|nr:hypothetical protein LSTR_LSTR013709 [Laodelphax striatellus]
MLAVCRSRRSVVESSVQLGATGSRKRRVPAALLDRFGRHGNRGSLITPSLPLHPHHSNAYIHLWSETRALTHAYCDQNKRCWLPFQYAIVEKIPLQGVLLATPCEESPSVSDYLQ